MRLRSIPLALALALAAALPRQAAAGPGYYVLTPYDRAGLTIVDLRYWAVRRGGAPEVMWPEAGLGYGVTPRWTTTVFASWVGSSQMATRVQTLNWQNNLLLTQGEWPIDVALHAQWIDHRIERGGRAFEWGPLLQTNFGRTQANLNLVFEHVAGLARGNGRHLKLQWQLRHPLLPGVWAGAQGFSERGPWRDGAFEGIASHRGGPAVFGRLRFGEKQTLNLQAAWLVGRTQARHGRMFTMQAAYEY